MADSGLKILFAGTPEFAAAHLRALLQSHHQVLAVYTQPDRPAGRGKQLQASPVKQLALEAGLPVEQPLSLKSLEAQTGLKEYGADLMVVVAYGLLLPLPVLETPRLGCINVHASLLPRWRGAAPIQRAIEAGDTETGVTIMQMDVGLDTGAMLLKRTCAIEPRDTASSLHDRLIELGPPALLETLQQLADGTAVPETQQHDLASYAHKLTKEEGLLDWSQSAQELDARVRAFNPFPIAYTLHQGETLRIYEATPEALRHQAEPGTLMPADRALLVACGHDTALRLNLVQLPGKKAMSAQDLLNGFSARFQPGSRLGAA
jgi:methionyl-tRNA formyltransferase